MTHSGLLGWKVCSRVLVVGLVGAALSGCFAPEAEFKQNGTYALVQKTLMDGSFTSRQMEGLHNTMQALYGTPDKPLVTKLTSAPIDTVLDSGMLEFAAGPVGSDESGRPEGLYREHCAHCHGVTGDGAGPTARFLNPYPRDYRKGVFKFKSTPKGEKPTHADLKRILMEGIPDTSMPSFRLLADDELEALVNYVKYLSIRGETERQLILEIADLDEEDDFVQMDGDKPSPNFTGMIAETVSGVVEKWAQAESKQTVIPQRPDWDTKESVELGRKLFYGPIAQCVKCHGESALGDGQRTDYDDWTKEYFDPSNQKLVALKDAFVEQYHAMPPRNIIPRNLRAGVYRGGRRPIDIYRRIHNGIDGSPMPAATMKAPSDPVDKIGLTPNDVWHLVDYVLSLPYESISRPSIPSPENRRERM